MFTPAEIQEIVEESGSRIRAKLVEGIDARVTAAMEQALHQQIADEVKTFVAAEVLPELRLQLIGEKPQIIAAAAASGEQIARKLCEHMVGRAENALSKNSYQSNDILKKLFGL